LCSNDSSSSSLLPQLSSTPHSSFFFVRFFFPFFLQLSLLLPVFSTVVWRFATIVASAAAIIGLTRLTPATLVVYLESGAWCLYLHSRWRPSLLPLPSFDDLLPLSSLWLRFSFIPLPPTSSSPSSRRPFVFPCCGCRRRPCSCPLFSSLFRSTSY